MGIPYIFGLKGPCNPKCMGIPYMFGLKVPCNSVAFYLGTTDFCLYQNIQTISGAYPAFYAMSGQRSQGIRLTIFLLVLRIRMSGGRVPFLHMPS